MTAATKLTAKAKAAFLEELALSGTYLKAAEAIGRSRITMWKLRQSDPDFAAECDAALEVATDRLEAEARRRAVDGTDRPVFYQGVICGYVKEYSDTLLLAKLKAKRAEYRTDTHKVDVTFSFASLIDELEKNLSRSGGEEEPPADE